MYLRSVSLLLLLSLQLASCAALPLKSPAPPDDIKGGLFVLSDFLKSLVPFLDDITPDIKLQTLCDLVRNITALGHMLQPTLNNTAFDAFLAIANGIKSDGCKWVGGSISCNAMTLDTVCANLVLRYSIQALRQAAGTSSVTPERVWVAQHLDSVNKTVLDMINTAVELFALSP